MLVLIFCLSRLASSDIPGTNVVMTVVHAYLEWLNNMVERSHLSWLFALALVSQERVHIHETNALAIVLVLSSAL